MEIEPPFPCLVGPTGIGKSEIAYLIAQRLGYEILSADAFQIYKGVEIGTAQPSREWQQKVPHHLVGIRNPRESWNAGDFSREASRILNDKKSRGIGMLVVGGSGFYIRALLEGLPTAPAVDPELRAQIVKKVEIQGLAAAHDWLASVDPISAGKIHVNDQYRICRALERALSPISDLSTLAITGMNAVLLGIECPREQLDEILKKRCSTIWGNGILRETEKLRSEGVSLDFPVWKAIGYLEDLDFLNGKISESDASEKMFRRTRQYAKRQWTWFRHQHKIKWFRRNPCESLNTLIDSLTSNILALGRKI